jgi:branched-chain amino acid transport system substrate-binding protein
MAEVGLWGVVRADGHAHGRELRGGDAMRRLFAFTLALALAAVSGSCSKGSDPIVVGATYPLTGSQGPGGLDEFRGVSLAADFVNRSGGVQGRQIELRSIDTPGSDAARAAVRDLDDQGVRFVLGSYGSTISLPAADEAARRGMLFWETGAVGDMTGSELGKLVFRVAPTGSSLGSAAVAFVAGQLAPLLGREASSLRFAVANVDDVYGRAVARGAIEHIRALGLPFAGQFAYPARQADFPTTVRRIAASRPDVLFVSAYLEDGIALREETLRQHVHLLASIGTSSSYCMPQFGAALGAGAVGLFASDKPDADTIGSTGLTTEAQALLVRANGEYRDRYGQEMSAAALAGFSAAWALFRYVMPGASAITPEGVAEAARAVRLPGGTLPNGSGLAFGSADTPDAGENMAAATVIEEWVAINQRATVWPPAFATEPVRAIPIAT